MLALPASAAAGMPPVGSSRELAEEGRGCHVPGRGVFAGELSDISPASLSVFAGGRRSERGQRGARVLTGSVPPPVLSAMSSGGDGIAGLVLLTGVTGTARALNGATLDAGEGADRRESKSDRDLEPNLSYEGFSSLGPFVGEPSRRLPSEFEPAQACHGRPKPECRYPGCAPRADQFIDDHQLG